MYEPKDLRILYKLCKRMGISYLLREMSLYCYEQASTDENIVVQEYHDQWMAARTELLRCAETIRKGGK